MNQEVYLNILNEQVLTFGQHLHDEYAIANPIFQDDNCRVHRARCYWFDKQPHPVTSDWRAKSSDVNLIENL